MTNLTTAMPKSPNQLTADEAIALLPKSDRVQVVEQSAISGKPDVLHVWHRDFAADKCRRHYMKRTLDGAYSKFPLHFVDDNANVFYLEGAGEA